jgi:RNA polymerase sigma factor (sigma-70 family)
VPELRVINRSMWEQAVSNPLPAILAALYHFVPPAPNSPELRLYAAIFGERAADRRCLLAELFMLLNPPAGEWEDYQDSYARWASGLLGESVARDTEMLREPLRQALVKIPEHLQEVLRLRFGLDEGEPQTLGQVGRQLGITREWIRQKEAKALRMLRHPSRSSHLRQLCPGEWLRGRILTALKDSSAPAALFLLWSEDRKRLDWLERMREQALADTARQIAGARRREEYLRALVKKLYRTPITEVGLSTRAVNALRRHPGTMDTPMVGEMAVLTDDELMNIRGIGKKTLHEVRQKIQEVIQEREQQREISPAQRVEEAQGCQTISASG